MPESEHGAIPPEVLRRLVEDEHGRCVKAVSESIVARAKAGGLMALVMNAEVLITIEVFAAYLIEHSCHECLAQACMAFAGEPMIRDGEFQSQVFFDMIDKAMPGRWTATVETKPDAARTLH
jgi:ArsR family metal-binding transcriptional regulator